MLRLLWPLALLWICFERTASLPIQITAISANFAKATETQVIGYSTNSAVGNFNSLQVGSTYVGTRQDLASNSAPSFFLFRSKLSSPMLQGSASDAGIIAIPATLVTEPKVLIVPTQFTTMQNHLLQFGYDTLSDAYTFLSTTVTTTSPKGFVGIVANSTTSNTIFWLNSNRRLYSWTATTGFGLYCQTLHGNAPLLQLYNSTVLVFSSSSTTIQFVSTTTMTMANTLTGSLRGDYFAVDSVDKQLLHVMSNISPFTLASLDIHQLGTYSSKVARIFASAAKSMMMTFGVFPYLAIFDSNSNLLLLAKDTLATVNSTIFEQPPGHQTQSICTQFTECFYPAPAFVGFIGSTLRQGTSTSFKFPVHFLVAGSGCVNYHSYYFYMDHCNRDANGNCLSCLSGNYKLPSGDTCFPVSNGLATSLVSSCSVPNCAECAESTTKCTKCTSAPQQLYLLNNVCLPSIVPGYGPAGGNLTTCVDSRCLDCSQDAQQCLECDTNSGWYLVQDKCVSSSQIRSLYMGIDPSTSKLQNCAVPQCLACVQDYRKCTDCDNTNGYVLSASSGLCMDTIVGTQRSRILLSYDQSKRTIKMSFLGPIDQNVTEGQFSISLRDAAEFRSPINCSTQNADVTVKLSSIGLDYIDFCLVTEKQIIDGMVTFDTVIGQSLNTSSGNKILGFPVSLDGLYVDAAKQESFLIAIGQSLGEVLNYAKVPVMFIQAILQSRAVGSPNYIFSQQTVLALLEGPWVDLPDQILYNSIQYIQGVPIFPNLFKYTGDDDSVCSLPPRYMKLEMSCLPKLELM